MIAGLQLFAGRRVVVVGSAPLAAAIAVADDELVVAVNGGISSVPRVDAWVVNSRNLDASSWSDRQRFFSRTMLKQAAGRVVDLAILLTKHDDAAAWTLKFLRNQGTTIRATVEIHNEQRRELEASAGARTAIMSKEALSAGFFAVVLCFVAAASTVRLEGVSWQAGYQYLPLEEGPTFRGHEAGDKWAFANLLQVYGARLTHQLPLPAIARRMARTAGARTENSQMPTPRRKPDNAPAGDAGEQSTPGAPAPASAGPLLVRATKMGFYANQRRRVGDVFELRNQGTFSPGWMERVPHGTPIGRAGAEPDVAAPTAFAASRLPRLKKNGVDLEETVPAAPTGGDPGSVI